MNTGDVREILSLVVSKDPEIMRILRNLQQERKRDLAMLKAQQDYARVRQGSDHLIHKMIHRSPDVQGRKIPIGKVTTSRVVNNGKSLDSIYNEVEVDLDPNS